MKPKVLVVDYGMGNVRSVYNACSYLGADVVISRESSDFSDSTHVILPGVGAFSEGIRALENHGIREQLELEIQKGKPLLGICLGMQLLARESYELGHNFGMNRFDASVREFDLSGTGLKVPHMGWNHVSLKSPHQLLKGLPKESCTFYFVHSFHLTETPPEVVLGTCSYGDEFPAIVAVENVMATQFHPEKSQDNGLHLLKNFLHFS